MLAGLSSGDEAVSDLLTSFMPKHIYKEADQVGYAHLVPHSKPHNQCPEGVSFGDDTDVPAIGYCCTHTYIRTYILLFLASKLLPLPRQSLLWLCSTHCHLPQYMQHRPERILFEF